MSGRARRGGRGAIAGPGALALVAWGAVGYVVAELDPASLASRLAFFGALGLALVATLGLIAYLLSFALFADPRYRGNLGRALQAGGVAAGVALSAVVLHVSGALTPVALAALLVLLLAGQIAVLLRE